MTNLHPQSEYYLHTNGKLIYKPHGDVDATSPFVRRVWNANLIAKSPASFALWLKEAYDLGADASEILRLAEHQKLFDFIPELRSIFEERGIIVAAQAETGGEE